MSVVYIFFVLSVLSRQAVQLLFAHFLFIFNSFPQDGMIQISLAHTFFVFSVLLIQIPLRTISAQDRMIQVSLVTLSLCFQF